MKWKSLPFLAVAVLAVAALALAAPASGQILFDAQLTGFAEVPPVDSDAFGSCTGVLTGFPDPDPSFHITCEHNVVDATMAHIHIGAPSVAGGIVFPLGDPNDIDETWDLSLDQAIRLLAGGYYVNVHSPTHPAGEIRGQLTARQTTTGGVETITFALTGDQEAPPVATDASGVCVATIEREGLPEQGVMDLYCTHDVVNVTAAHIHSGEVGVAGGVVVPLGVPTSPIIVEDIFLDPELAADLRDGLLYVNVHSTAFPNGEIRGQITGCFSSTTVLCLANGRFAVEVDWETELGGGGSGQGVAVTETDNTGMFWFFEPSNLEIMVKVLDGCVVNDHFWVFFAGLTNVGFDLRVTDTVSGEVRIYSNADETPANPVLDTAAFDTCDVP
jgi:hypothetical protein